MADGTNSGGGATPWLAFLIGGLIVAVAVMGFFMFHRRTFRCAAGV